MNARTLGFVKSAIYCGISAANRWVASQGWSPNLFLADFMLNYTGPSRATNLRVFRL